MLTNQIPHVLNGRHIRRTENIAAILSCVISDTTILLSNGVMALQGLNSKPNSQTSASKDGVIKYSACDEEYCDPPTEEWNQCCKCQEWWHEEYFNY
ncbi:hypothetical protein TNCV_4893081 [Trichonephila clavipes]|nr:hypothetical protein TNCV_4893081 [Trichonephila clavipes]